MIERYFLDNLGAASDRKISSAQYYPAIGDCISGAYSNEWCHGIGGNGANRINKAH
jgi:hypothetical protein